MLAAAGLVIALAFVGGSCAPTGVYHVVKPGQTLYRIAKTYEIDEAKLAKVNGITDPTRLEVGQRLYVPGVRGVRNIPAPDRPKATPTAAAAPPGKPPAKDQPTPKAAKSPRAVARSTIEEFAAPRPVPGTFVWPVRGQVVGEFGTASGKSSKGIEIAVPHGTPVVAAAAGKVIYSDQGIRGYGNLVILEHADSFFTVYGFNAKNLVTVNSFVGQGQKIALSGAPPGSKSPRLHFEIRKGRAAMNPIFFLP